MSSSNTKRTKIKKYLAKVTAGAEVGEDIPYKYIHVKDNTIEACNKNYYVRLSHKGYAPKEVLLDTEEFAKGNDVLVDIPPEKFPDLQKLKPDSTPVCSFMLNRDYLLNILQCMEDYRIRFSFYGKSQPILINGDEGFSEAVIMPIINSQW